jgi:lathosterol oxidase
MNVFGHMGYEFFPKGFASHKILKWHNTATNHNMHHRFVKCNYGLYFNIWDRMMKTNHPKYEEIYDEVIAQRELGKNAFDHVTEHYTADVGLIPEERLQG